MSSVEEDARRSAEKHALVNALRYDGTASQDAVMGAVMGEDDRFPRNGGVVANVVQSEIERVNALSVEEQRARLENEFPNMVEELDSNEEESAVLPDLPNVDEYDEVRMRLAPNPNGSWHLGHARMPAVIGTYKQMYDGWMLCRFDDTDPKTKRPSLEAYDAILNSVEYLGFEPDDVVKASDRVDEYYQYARKLIKVDGAYTCTCDAETLREKRRAGETCSHRSKDAETTMDEFEDMISGTYEEGDIVLRVKTDIEHKNPAIRDWVAFRIIDKPHPRDEAQEYRCWPALDFQSAIDDHEFEITHIIRGIDLQDSAKRQQFLYDYFDWDYPEVVHWGRVEVDGFEVPLSASSINEAVERGEVDSWEDPRAPTLDAMKRRGVTGQAIVESMVELGMSKSNVTLSTDTVYHKNTQVIDDDTDRYFLVREPYRKIQVTDGADAGTPPVHPDHDDRGVRTIPVNTGVCIEEEDIPDDGDRVWLKGYGCVRYNGDSFAYIEDADPSIIHDENLAVIHWAPIEENREVTLRTPSGNKTGVAEPTLNTAAIGDTIQFERVGFARLDSKTGDSITAYYAHR